MKNASDFETLRDLAKKETLNGRLTFLFGLLLVNYANARFRFAFGAKKFATAFTALVSVLTVSQRFPCGKISL